MTDVTRTAFRTCPLCEAGCGLEITVAGDRVVRIRGDRDDVFSRGYLCPKGSTLKQLHEDPDRLRRPVVKRDGVFVEVDWDEAWREVEARLVPVIERHGRDAVAVYLGNPSAHNLGAMLYNRVLIQALGTRQRYSASTVDQMPKQVAAGFMFGTAVSVPVPDLDRTGHLLMLGANPYASNGSLCTAPDFPGRLEAIQARGGKLVVVDPRRSRTAEQADEWLPIVPGTDALFLMALVHTLFDEGLADPGPHVGPWLNGLDEVAELAAGFPPEQVAAACGIDAATIRRTARELAAAPAAAVYGRIGTCTQEFGTLASWLVDVLNVLTGNLDRPGGAMFTLPALGGPTVRGTPGKGTGFSLGRQRTRVRGLPQVLGEFPVVALAEEIDTPGEGQVRALVTMSGNPVLSTPNSERLDAALASLECMVSVDIYVNETTRHADVILPAPSSLQRSHYDVALLAFAVRNVANYSPPVFPLEPGQPDEWEILCKLALIAQGQGAGADVGVVDELAAMGLATSIARAAADDPGSPFAGMSADEILAAVSAGGRRGPERLLDLQLRAGPYRISLDELIARPHGIDFGALEPRLPGVLRTASGRIELAPAPIVADVERLRAAVHRPAPDAAAGSMLLVGRRDLRSNNSWMHNLPVLVKGRPRCTLHVHPADAEVLGLADGDLAQVESRVGRIEAPVEVTDAVRRGVVSLPHGWGHGQAGTRMAVANAEAYRGVNSNVLADHDAFDPLSGNAVLNGIPVAVRPADRAAAGALAAATG